MIPTVPELERRLIPVTGCDLACWHRPSDGKQWVLWLHGACGRHQMWARQMDQFTGADLLFLDLRGQGESPMHTGERVSFTDTVDDIAAVLDAYGIDSAVLIGHSWGGNPAQEFAYRYPDRTDGLVMVGAWGQLRPMSDAERRRIKYFGPVYRRIPWSLISFMNPRMCSDVPETRALIGDAIRATGRDVFIDLGISAYAEVHEVETYPVHTPTLLVRGSLDFPKALSAIYGEICEKNPAAREAVIDATRHMPMMDTPDAFNGLIDDFLARLRQPTAS